MSSLTKKDNAQKSDRPQNNLKIKMHRQGLRNEAVFKAEKEKATDSAFLLHKPQLIHDTVCF